MKLSQLANNVLKNNGLRLYILLSLSIFLILIFFSLLFNQIEIILFLNQFNSIFFDYFFQYFTVLGDGIICVILILLFFKNPKYRFVLILSSIIILLTTLFLKQIVFKDSLRPITFFGNNLNSIHLVKNVVIFSKNSFPSGHTMVAFGLMSILANYFNSKSKAVFCFLIAVLVGYSRIYLFQHFLIDVICGGLIGTFISVSVLIISDLKHENQ